MKILVIIGSIREGRKGDKVAKAVFDLTPKSDEVSFELVDLKDYPMPIYADPRHPRMANGDYPDEHATAWCKKVDEADGYVIVTPEYNHGYPASLKNALDYPYTQWNNKAVGFVSYGGYLMGGRAIEQLRQVAAELQMADIRESVSISNSRDFNEQGNLNIEPYEKSLETFFKQLIWWTKALKKAREENKTKN